LLKTKSRTKTELLKVSSARQRARQEALDALLAEGKVVRISRKYFANDPGGSVEQLIDVEAARLDAYLRSVPDALARSDSKLRRAVKDNALASAALQRLLETGQVIELKYKKQRLCLHSTHLPQRFAQVRQARFMAASEILEEVQRRAVSFFWEKADPHTGLVSDRTNNFGFDNRTEASTASTGYGLAALPIGVERGWLNRNEAAERARVTMRFVLAMPNERGWLAHFVDKRDGKSVWNSEVSSIDTALLVSGALVCSRYFGDDDIVALADVLYRRIDWWWMLTNNGTKPNKRVISHGWRPETRDFIKDDYSRYCEAILLYLLGMGAPVDPLPQTTWDEIERPLQIYAGIESLKEGPIFIHQMPCGYLNLRNQRDRLGFDYWESCTNAMKIHRQFCIDHPERKTYAQGFWGLNASDGPDGYHPFGAPEGHENGTVSPTGAISSITFTPELALAAARALYDKNGLWGNYGFVNAFNIDRNWNDPDVIGIDLGMVLLAIENYRSGLVWKLMDSSIVPGLRAAGFRRTTEFGPRPVYLPPMGAGMR
jgi:hypothetical protein